MTDQEKIAELTELLQRSAVILRNMVLWSKPLTNNRTGDLEAANKYRNQAANMAGEIDKATK